MNPALRLAAAVALLATGGVPATVIAQQPSAQAESSVAPRPWGVLLRLGFDFGGDELTTVAWDDGTEKTLKAGQLLYFSAGFLYHPEAPYTVEATIGYKFDKANGSNGSIGFTRVPVDVIGSWAMGGLRLGAGPTIHLGPKFECDATGIVGCPVTYEYDTAIGGVVQAAYGFGGASGYDVGIRYTFIEYSGPGLYTKDGGGFGFFFGGWL